MLEATSAAAAALPEDGPASALDEDEGPLSLAMSKALAGFEPATSVLKDACSTVGVLVTELPVLLSLCL